MSGILCLKWNNHTSTFIKTLDNLRSKELYCDATIACHGKYYPVHRFVLTTCSEYFEDIFERTQCKHPFIIVKDVEEIQLEALLNYMYKGEVNVLQDRLPALIKAAEALKVKGLAVPEDDLEECSTSLPKEKRKSSLCSSPLEPKPKKRSDKRVSEDSQSDSKDDEITEIVTHKSTSSKRTRDLKRSRDSKSRNAGDKNLRYHNSSPLKGNVTSDKNSQGEEIKIEPNEIFETVDEEFPPNSMEADPESIQQEESLFVSLLSPNNVQSVLDEDLGTGDEGTSQDLPQCSSWSDDVNTNSEKIQDDDILAIDDIKIEEQDVSCEPSEHFLLEDLSLIDTGKRPKGISQCPLCSYKTKYKTNMKTHIARKHAESLPFECSWCKYKSSTKESLKIHMRRHTGEKPYKCKFCPYKAAHYNSIKLHNNIHTSNKPFRCRQCPYKAAQKSSLYNHMRQHESN